MKTLPWAVFAVVLVMALPPVCAFAMRCGGDLVQEGDYKFEVLDKCGEPDLKELVGYVINRRGDREMQIEQWVYGPMRGLYYILHFEGATLKRIETRLKR
ncbi:MAG: DUF2845 domain-containing protein [Desulfobacterales bacterium]|nr:DUF2845 domain-containing protein [Desulfobacterales bacterium]